MYATQWHAAESCVWRTWASRFINSATPSCVIDQITKAVGTLYTSWKSRLTTRLLKHRGWDKMAIILQTILSNWFSCTKIAFWFKFQRDIPFSKKQHWFRWFLAAEQASSHHMNQQATGLDAWASRVKCPARFVSHLHEICIYIYELFIAFVSFVVCSLL